jgi:hypothetical protein
VNIKIIAIVGACLIAGAGAYVVFTGENQVISIGSSDGPKLKIEAAGMKWSGWPEISILANDKEIKKIKIETQDRTMYDINVPSEIGAITKIEVKLLNEYDCRGMDSMEHENDCTDRLVILRGAYLDGKKLENPQASGPMNLSSLLRREEGGISWQVSQ